MFHFYLLQLLQHRASVCQESGTEYIMSLLNFPSEVTIQLLQKMNLFDRINLSITHTRLLLLCFDRTLNRKSKKTLTLNELRQLYEQSRTEIERDQCFKSNVLDRLMIKNFNEIVRLYMDTKNEYFLTNGKILHSLEGKFVVEGEHEKFSLTFLKQFLHLLKIAKGNILLAFVDVKRIEKNYAKRCAQILKSKLIRGRKVYIIDFTKTLEFGNKCADQIMVSIKGNFTILYSFTSNDLTRNHYILMDKRNSVANTKEIIDMINEDRFAEAKQHLKSVLALVEAAELVGRGRDIRCVNCGVWEDSTGGVIEFKIDEPAWSNCAGCELK